ncbi:hypothetical protein CLOM_g10922 [Closterium sp. NIES-68]|nr:hypothetical protein CLOM_g10922 [Closterium sp. NIES-68]GJP57786.1 hypothetical protein CLOP_g17380 [Closterium sp. NIES-67]
MAPIVAHDSVPVAARRWLVVGLLLAASLGASPALVAADLSEAHATDHSAAQTTEAAAAAEAAAAGAAAEAAAAGPAVVADPEPYCEDLSKGPIVREIPTLYQDSYGMEGVSVITLGGKVQHGLKHVEVFMMTFAPGAKTPIHSHPQEEVVVFTRGVGKVLVVEDKKAEPSSHEVKRNTTVTFHPKALHQIANDGDTELQLIASYSKPPHKMAVHATWQTSRKDAESAGRATWDACVVREGEVAEGERGEGEAKEGVERKEGGAAAEGDVAAADVIGKAEEEELRRDLEGGSGAGVDRGRGEEDAASASQEVKDEL